ncbi:MAG: PEP-CTERM sorting domain-containing protein [Planctomycetota bacterium]|jgi:hypothetical protein
MHKTVTLIAALSCLCIVTPALLADGPDGDGKPDYPAAIDNANGVSPAVLEFILANDPPYGSELPGIIEEYRNSQESQESGNGDYPPAIDNANGVAPAVLEFKLANDPPYGSELPGIIEEYRNSLGSQSGDLLVNQGGPPNGGGDNLGAAVRGWLDDGYSGTDLAEKIHEELGVETGQDGLPEPPVGGPASLEALSLSAGAGETMAVVPEPVTLSLLALGACPCLLARGRRRSRQALALIRRRRRK